MTDKPEWPKKLDLNIARERRVEGLGICFNSAISQCEAVRDSLTVDEIEKICSNVLSDYELELHDQRFLLRELLSQAILTYIKTKLGGSG